MAKGKVLSKKEMQTKITELGNLLKDAMKLLKKQEADAAAVAAQTKQEAPAKPTAPPAPGSIAAATAIAKAPLKPGDVLLTKPIIPLPIPKAKPGKKPEKQKFLTGYDSKTKHKHVRMEIGANGHEGRPWWKLPGRVNADGKIVSVPRQIPIY